MEFGGGLGWGVGVGLMFGNIKKTVWRLLRRIRENKTWVAFYLDESYAPCYHNPAVMLLFTVILQILSVINV